jgi:hypothetical protein
VRLPELLSFWVAHALAWPAVSVEAGRELVWKRVAYATRYGKGCSLGEALALDTEALGGYLQALGQLVKEENEAAKSKA